MHFFPLWLCLVSTLCVSCHYDFVLFLRAFPTAVVLHDFTLLYFRKFKIHPYLPIKRHYGFSAIYCVGLANTFYFPFSSFIHYIGLSLLALLLFFLLIYSTGPHLLGSILFLSLLSFSNTHFTLQEGLPITHLYSQPYSSRRASYYTTTKRGPWAYLWTLFFILKILFFFRLSPGPYLCIGRLLSLFSYSNPSLGAFLGFSPHGLLDTNLQKLVSTIVM